ncbi:hypothetical protein DY000_02008584 [Brassica cretica]|uniref:VQ domain-containing protein n=1 Tax=Brassica cretica TaxID=69181 RepID=A0ABQ7CCB5_BRACR|nr:hypothetical protein DY000_02008584 [Brassica cretica]
MQSVWKVPGHDSDVNPPAFITGEPPPILPPDPPDPTSPLSPANFLTLTETATKTVFSGSSRKGPRRESKLSATTSFAPQKTQDTITCSGTISMEIEKENPTLSIIVTVPESESESATVQSEDPPPKLPPSSLPPGPSLTPQNSCIFSSPDPTPRPSL